MQGERKRREGGSKKVAISDSWSRPALVMPLVVAISATAGAVSEQLHPKQKALLLPQISALDTICCTWRRSA